MIPLAMQSAVSGSFAITATSTSRAAAAMAASIDVGPVTSASNTYGRERRSTALTASWTAACTMAYIRDSPGPLPLIRHAAFAALRRSHST